MQAGNSSERSVNIEKQERCQVPEDLKFQRLFPQTRVWSLYCRMWALNLKEEINCYILYMKCLRRRVKSTIQMSHFLVASHKSLIFLRPSTDKFQNRFEIQGAYLYVTI